jgi:hypothetical protein
LSFLPALISSYLSFAYHYPIRASRVTVVDG